MSGRTSRRLAGEERGFGDVERGKGARGVLAFTEDAFKGRTREPNHITSSVHINREGLGFEGEGKRIIASGSERKRYLLVVVSVFVCMATVSSS